MAKSKKPVVVVTRKLPDSVETRMRELFDTRLNLDDKPMSQGQLAAAMKTADVLVPTVTDRIDAAVLKDTGANLKLIANFGNGVDNIDVAAAVARGITVTNTPGVLTEDTADMTMALILAVPRRLTRERGGFVTGQQPAEMHEQANGNSRLLWRLAPGVVGQLGDCGSGWCQFTVGPRRGFVEQTRVWGAGEP